MMSVEQSVSWLLGVLSSMADVVLSKEVVAMAAIVGTGVTVYTFGYKRPELVLDVEPEKVEHACVEKDEGRTESSFALLLANVGNSFAEDVQLTMTLDAFNFDNDIEATDAVTAEYAPPQAMFEIKSGRKTGFGGGGRRHDIFLENVVYEGDVQELYLGSAVFRAGTHDLIYTVSCRSHGPRKGKIVFDVEDGQVTVTDREYPTWRRNIKALLYWSVERKREQQVENIDPDDVEIEFEVH